jgi:hypothetical protein
VAEGVLEVTPTDGIEVPAPPDKPVPVLSDEEIAALLKAYAVLRGRPGVFDRAVTGQVTPWRSAHWWLPHQPTSGLRA